MNSPLPPKDENVFAGLRTLERENLEDFEEADSTSLVVEKEFAGDKELGRARAFCASCCWPIGLAVIAKGRARRSENENGTIFMMAETSCQLECLDDNVGRLDEAQ